MYRCEGDDIMIAFEVEAFTQPARLVNDPDKLGEEVDEAIIKLWLSELPLLFPPMKRASYRGGHNSVYDCTPDENPIIGKTPEVEGFYLCSGWSGIGFQQSPAIGEVMADLIMDDRKTLIDWSVFRLSRFNEGKPIAGAWGFH